MSQSISYASTLNSLEVLSPLDRYRVLQKEFKHFESQLKKNVGSENLDSPIQDIQKIIDSLSQLLIEYPEWELKDLVIFKKNQAQKLLALYEGLIIEKEFAHQKYPPVLADYHLEKEREKKLRAATESSSHRQDMLISEALRMYEQERVFRIYLEKERDFLKENQKKKGELYVSLEDSLVEKDKHLLLLQEKIDLLAGKAQTLETYKNKVSQDNLILQERVAETAEERDILLEEVRDFENKIEEKGYFSKEGRRESYSERVDPFHSHMLSYVYKKSLSQKNDVLLLLQHIEEQIDGRLFFEGSRSRAFTRGFALSVAINWWLVSAVR